MWLLFGLLETTLTDVCKCIEMLGSLDSFVGALPFEVPLSTPTVKSVENVYFEARRQVCSGRFEKWELRFYRDSLRNRFYFIQTDRSFVNISERQFSSLNCQFA